MHLQLSLKRKYQQEGYPSLGGHLLPLGDFSGGVEEVKAKFDLNDQTRIVHYHLDYYAIWLPACVEN